MEKEFVSYEQAVAVIELGFREPTIRGWDVKGKIWYHPDSDVVVDNPTKSQVFRWFREKCGLNSYVKHECSDINCYYDYVINDYECDEIYKTYEEAENELINELILIAKRKI